MLRKILLEIINKSFGLGFQSFISSAKSIRTWLLGSAGSFFSTNKNVISSDIFTWWPIFKSTWANIIFLFISLFFLIFVYYQIKYFLIESWRKWILIKRESVYGKAIVFLAEAYSLIHENRKKNTNDLETKTVLTQFCNNIKAIFDYKTQSNSSVSIKVIADFMNPNDVLTLRSKVENLVRDSSAQSRDSANYKAIEHNIAKNTCYQQILTNFVSGNSKHKIYFLSNDLPELDNYENSSFEQYPDFIAKYKEDKKLRKKHWPLVYRSELVVPITPWNSSEGDELAIIGFVCIDCELEKKEVFNHEYDAPMIKGISDGLYEFIKEKIFKK